jgi:RHS repeat-associated protein
MFMCQRSSSPALAPLAIGLLCLVVSGEGLASSGVSDERVVLPDGPGSIGGIGENADVDPNMGLMSTSVPFEIPEGRPGMTPDLRLSYSSGAGTSVVGIGWSFDSPSIERTSLRGVPEYDLDDEFVVNGGSELVLVDEANRIYRSRYEQSFVRYQWHETGDGSEGYWTGEEPDGRVHYFGADETGALAPAARVAGGGGTFRYHLVATVDPYNHAVRYLYTQDGGTSLLTEVRYLVDGAGNHRFSVVLTYQDRPDIISDCIPGVNVLLRKRLTGVVVLSHGPEAPEPIRRLFLEYEETATSGGASRLKSVQTFGRGDEPFPGTFTFEYSASLTGACAGNCEGPYLVDLGTLPGGVVLQNGRATLLDINGDALPDILSTPSTGGHSFIMSSLDATGRPSFASTATPSSANVGTGFVLDSPSVQTIDVDGDGFTDIISAGTGLAYCNDGSGDWTAGDCLMNAAIPGLQADDAGDADPRFVRFFDYDNDKRIDVLRTNASSTEVLHNTPDGFVSTPVDDIESVFDQDPLHLADMNGDGLQDPVEILPGGQINYRLNLGLGKWTAWTTVSLSGFTGIDPTFMELEDVNGDGLTDVVAIVGLEMRYAINRGGDVFDAALVLTSDDVTGGLAERVNGTTVLFADMNGNGTRDIVWFQPDGSVQMVELFPVRPNLLTRIENGLGRVQTVEYGTSVVQLATSPEPWAYKLPHAMNLVIGTDSWVTLTGGEAGAGIHEEQIYRYYDGYYDGEDDRFRGFARVEVSTIAETGTGSQPASRATLRYDVGIDDAYFNGLLLEKLLEAEVDGAYVPLNLERTSYEDCDVAGVPTTGLALPVRFICSTATELTVQEGAPVTDWRTTRMERTYDGYGNVIVDDNLGVVSTGDPAAPAGCAACTLSADEFGLPCGNTCTGDEWVEQTEYVVPGNNTGGAWFLRSPYIERAYASAGGDATEVLTYYDGDPFLGFAAGVLDKGSPTRTESLVETGRYIQSQRVAYDDHGNVIIELDPLGSAENTTSHREVIDYDGLGFRIREVRKQLEAPDGSPYELVRSATWEPAWLQMESLSNWRVVVDGAQQTPSEYTTITYDAFGRTETVQQPDDDDGDPSRIFTYELSDPVSRILMEERSEKGGPFDLKKAQCVDGKGRLFQERTETAAGEVLVSGFAVFNKRGLAVRQYQPWSSDTLACDAAPPEDVLYSQYFFDGANRPTGIELPDGDLYGTPTRTRIVYLPLELQEHDGTDMAGETFADTPRIKRTDGLGRVVEVVEAGGSAGDDAVWTIRYDGTGDVARVIDPNGNEKTQVHDLSGRILEVRDPNAGSYAFVWDDAGNLLERTDARGKTLAATYDGLNRPWTRFDPDDADGTRVEMDYDLSSLCDGCAYGAGELVSARYPLGAGLDGEGREIFDRDSRGRTIRFTRTLHGHSFDIETEWDHADRRIRTTYPDGTVLDSTWDGANRLAAVDGLVDAFRYDDRGRLTAIERANGITTTRGYDSVERLSSISTARGSSVLQAFALTHDRDDNVLEATQTGSDPLVATTARSFTLDHRHRTVEVEHNGLTVTTTWDLSSNPTARDVTPGTHPLQLGAIEYGGDAPFGITSAGGVSYAYDAAGYMVSRGGRTLDWDYQGRLVSIDSDEHRYVYAADEERIVRRDTEGLTFYVNSDFEVRDGVAVILVRNGKDRVVRIEDPSFQTALLPDSDADGVITSADAWAASGGQQEELLFAAARRSVTPTREVSHLEADHLGNVTLASDESGTVTGGQAYAHDGAIVRTTGYVGRYGFTGQEHDASGLVHYRYRSLDPDIGRFVSVDPSFLVLTEDSLEELSEATSAFGYVSGRTSALVDPDGLAPDGKRSRSKTLKGKSAKKAQKKLKKMLKKRKKKLKKAKKKADKARKKAAKQLKRAQTISKGEKLMMKLFNMPDPRPARQAKLAGSGSDPGDTGGSSGREPPDMPTSDTSGPDTSDPAEPTELVGELTRWNKVGMTLFNMPDPRKPKTASAPERRDSVPAPTKVGGRRESVSSSLTDE